MLDVMVRNWWVLALRGIAAIIFGIAFILAPLTAISVLVLIWGAYALIDGVFSIFAAFKDRERNRNWWMTLLEGIIGILVGIGVFLFPITVINILFYVIAFWAIFTGIFEIIAAIQLRKEIEGEFWLGLSGVLSIVFGILLILFPLAGILTISWLVAGYAIIFGVMMLALAFRLRGMNNQQGSTTQRTA